MDVDEYGAEDVTFGEVENKTPPPKTGSTDKDLSSKKEQKPHHHKDINDYGLELPGEESP